MALKYTRIDNIIVAARILRDHGSKSDIVALFQMSHHSNYTELPEEDSRVLEQMNVKIQYIPKSPNENFYRTNVDKFRILGLSDYRRVLFMDGDVMPTKNLDYLFEMSDGPNAVLKENVVMQGVWEPANGGFFMLAPNQDDLRLVNSIIQQREEYARTHPYPFFDVVNGWGHTHDPSDPWLAKSSSGTNWTFLAAFADQGLLYHWVKYAKKSVSIVQFNGNVHNWGLNSSLTSASFEEQNVTLQEILVKPFDGGSNPRRDFIHFTGNTKPWLRGAPQDISNKTKSKSEHDLWFYTLSTLNDELKMDLNFTSWKGGDKKKRPKHGLYPVYVHAKEASSNLLERVGSVNRTTSRL